MNTVVFKLLFLAGALLLLLACQAPEARDSAGQDAQVPEPTRLETEQSPAVKIPGVKSPQIIALSSPNAERLATWYGEMFGLEPRTRFEPDSGEIKGIVIGNDALIVEIIQHIDAVSPEELAPDIGAKFLFNGIFKVGFFVDDFDNVFENLQGEFELSPENIRKSSVSENTRVLIIRDPDGNQLQIQGVSQKY